MSDPQPIPADIWAIVLGTPLSHYDSSPGHHNGDYNRHNPERVLVGDVVREKQPKPTVTP